MSNQNGLHQPPKGLEDKAMKTDGAGIGEGFGRRAEDKAELETMRGHGGLQESPRRVGREQPMPMAWGQHEAPLRPRRAIAEGTTVMFSTQANRSIVEQLKWYAKERGVSIVSVFEAAVIEFLQRRGR